MIFNLNIHQLISTKTPKIDARLHLSEPEIILRSPSNGKILMRWKGNMVQKWIDQGDITYNELSESHYHWLELLQSTR